MNDNRTQGEWSVNEDDLTIRAGILNIAQVTETLTRSNGIGEEEFLITAEQAVANAHLLASAPDLVRVLDHPIINQILGEIEDSDDGRKYNGTLWSLALQWMELRDAVLNKANGNGHFDSDDWGKF